MENTAIVNELLWRYTTKKFNPVKRVSNEELAIILETLRLTPSSINSQPWRFIVLESNEAKQRFFKTFENKFQFNREQILNASHIILFAHNLKYTREDFAKVIDKGIEDKRIKPEDRDKAFASFMFAELNTDANGSTASWTKPQLYIALGNVLHTLARMEIDSTPMEGIDVESVNNEFKTELDGYLCELALAIGYRHDDDYNAKLPKSRLAINQIVKRI